VPEAWRLRGAPWPAIRRGFVVATPVGIALLGDLEAETEVAAGLATAAMICGFIAFDAPARVRVRWQLCCAPLVGAAAALGVLSSATAATAVAAMLLVAGVCGYLVAVSLRLAIAGLTWTLALVISQGLFLDPADAPQALLYGTCGGLAQALMAAIAWVGWDGEREPGRVSDAVRGAIAKLRAAASWRDASLRHALRFGAAMGIGVAIYRLAGFEDHGYWVPLTILFVLKPDPDQTAERIAMRAAGTVAGLLVATALAELLVNDVVVTALVLVTAAALSYALLAIEYALFTTAITVFVVLLTDSLGAGPLDTAGERGLGTLLGIGVVAVAFRALRQIEEEEDERRAEARGVM
jgi:Fusaric acid resistance protein-like